MPVLSLGPHPAEAGAAPVQPLGAAASVGSGDQLAAPAVAEPSQIGHRGPANEADEARADPFAGTILADTIPDRRSQRVLAGLGPGPWINGKWQRPLPRGDEG